MVWIVPACTSNGVGDSSQYPVGVANYQQMYNVLRRNRRAEYEKYRLPSHWRGMPTPIPAIAPSMADKRLLICSAGVPHESMGASVVLFYCYLARLRQDG